VVIEESLVVAAPAQRVWNLVAHPEQMTALSPEVERVDWIDTAVPKPGAMFRGHNRVGRVRWSTTNIVETVEPSRVFSWRTVEGKNVCVSRWTYRIEPRSGGCEVIERYESVNLVAAVECVLGRAWMLRRGMRATLRELGSAVENRPAG
jgi:uncharacterized protein YndB with AHSA1/START domain